MARSRKKKAKFKVEVQGKHSADECVRAAATEFLEDNGYFYEDNPDDWDERFEDVYTGLAELVYKFVRDGEGGDDSVVLEFDANARTCRVVPVGEKP